MKNEQKLKTSKIDWNSAIKEFQKNDLLIFAAGFEDRSLHVLKKLINNEIVNNYAVIQYSSGPEENRNSLEKAKNIISGRNNNSAISFIDLDTNNAILFEKKCEKILKKYQIVENGSVWLDISGIPTFAICTILRILRKLFPLYNLKILYTEAKEYYPTKKEYMNYIKEYGDSGVERLPKSLTMEMSENLILESFAGFTIRRDPTCLILYAGYEKHRSFGVIETINPSKIVIIYSRPERKDLIWRLKMSKKLHANLINERVRSEEEVSTLSINDNLALLFQYYEMLFDDHNICIAPICSKMQAVASYLFWEHYRDLQLVFPLPVRYLSDRYSRGAGDTFLTILPPPPGLNIYKTPIPHDLISK